MVRVFVNLCWRLVCLLAVTGSFHCGSAYGQIDVARRDLVELGYNAALEGHPPLAAYFFYYHNQPEFLRPDLTLRLAVAPTYLDTQLGVSGVLGEHTDLGIGVAGGGYSDNYREIQQGTFWPSQSFLGHSAQVSFSLYHLFNPEQRIPLYGLVCGLAHYSVFARDDRTADDFVLPQDGGTFSVRTGLRWGGREPKLLPPLAMELSVWYQGLFRTWSGTYGYGDRAVQPASHLFWARAMVAYTLPECQQRVGFTITAGTSLSADRFSAYRLGGLLPLIAEFPLSLPGYYYQEISATDFVLISGNYRVPLDHRKRWNLIATASTSVVDYLPGLEQPGRWNTGVGGGLLYDWKAWRVMLGYSYGIDAIRSHGRGAQSLNFLLQFDLGKAMGRQQ